MANTYNYNGEMLRPSAILKHYPNISIATMRNWLRACDAISDVKEQLDTRYQKLYATGIKSKAEQLYVYNGKLSFTRSIADEIGVATPTVYEWLKPYKAYTDITQVITAKLWCRDADILYHGEQTKAYRVLSGIDADVVDFGQILSTYQVEYALGKINFVLPESFEWLLLQSGIFEGVTGKVEEPENNGANGSQYDTWENYFEDLLNKLMLENGAHGYSKSGDMGCFIQDCCHKDIPCDLRKLPARVKINNILKLLGVEMEL